MKVLLDTNALLWSLLLPDRLSKAAASEIADVSVEVLVSAASAWEIATKVRLGKLPEGVTLEENFVASVKRAGYILLPIEVEVALRSGRLPGAHRDPFDPMIAAQAQALDIPVISSDAKLDGFGVRRIW